jgi:hypothetical protein
VFDEKRYAVFLAPLEWTIKYLFMNTCWGARYASVLLLQKAKKQTYNR